MAINSLYYQVASFFFLFAAIFSDILLVRFCLVVANFLLIICSILGWPMWPDLVGSGVALDSLLWCTLAFAFHLWAFILLVMYERTIKRFTDDDMEALYQLFRRRTGIGRREFRIILGKGRFTRVNLPGTNIPTDDELHVIIQGQVYCEIEGWTRRYDVAQAKNVLKCEPYTVTLTSGEIFDLRLANIFGVPIGFFNTSFVATSVTNDVLLFSWNIAALEEFSKGPPIVLQAWRYLITFAVADTAHRPWMSDAEKELRKTQLRHMDFELQHEAEEPRKTCSHYFWWVLKSMDPRPPPGIRRIAIPVLSLGTSQVLMQDPRLASSLHKI